MPSVYNYLSEKLFEITHWKNWSTLPVFGWFAQRICLFCLSACLCQIPVTGAHVLRRELGSSAEPFSTFLSSLNQPLSFSGRAPRTWAHMVSGKTSVMAVGSTPWQRRWRERKQENQAEVKERVESWHVDTRKQVETATGVVLNVETVVTRQLSGSVPVVIPLSAFSSFRPFILGHPHRFTLQPKPSALGWGICAK